MPEASSADRSQALLRFGVRALRIAASTISLIELLRSDWTGGVAAGAAWLLFTQVERRLGSGDASSNTSSSSTQKPPE